MALVYITGIAGAGKTTVRNELRRRGFEAFGTDEDNLAAFYHNETGKNLGNDVPPSVRTEQWRKEHSWKVPYEAVVKLRDAADAKGTTVFLCGVVSNDAEFWDIFSQVIALTINKETLIQRLRDRPNNNFGKLDHELRDVLEWQETALDSYKELGSSIVDSTRPLNEVVDEILAICEIKH
jgi:broad-specificity NMP kinase